MRAAHRGRGIEAAVGWMVALVGCGPSAQVDRQGATPTTSPAITTRPGCCEQTIGDGNAPTPSIAQVQGRSHRSPYEGDAVSVTGSVTAVLTNGCFIEAPDDERDGDDASSEGLFVYTSTAPEVTVGDRVRVFGTVSEYGADLPRTELTDATLDVLAHGVPPPAAVVLGGGGRRAPDRIGAPTSSLDPGNNALDFYESLEGMRITVPDAVVAGALHGSLVTLLPDAGRASEPRTDAGGVRLTESDANPERIVVDTSRLGTPTSLDVGARLDGSVSGVMDYRNGRYLVLADGAWPAVVPSAFTARTATLSNDDAHWTVATFNADNLSPTNSAHVLDVAELIARRLGGPDVVALEEVQDQNGTATGELSAKGTLDALCAAIAATGGPEYRATDIAPAAENADGGAPGGNIRIAMLYRTDRVTMTLRGSAAPNAAIAVGNDHGRAYLSPLPGRIDPAAPAFDGSRKPLVAEFARGAARLVTIAVHLSSRLGDDPLFGAVQPPRSPSEELRRRQAELVAGFVQRVRAIEPDAPLVVLGDFNDFEYGPALTALAGAPLTDVTALLPPATRYSYVYEGNAQLLDHVLVAAELAPRTEVEVVHTNADFADSARASDHDPVLARIAIAP